MPATADMAFMNVEASPPDTAMAVALGSHMGAGSALAGANCKTASAPAAATIKQPNPLSRGERLAEVE
jgi:hypothetical protein